MKQLLFALLFIPSLLFAQKGQDEQYLAGAVPLENGKVVFSRDIQVPSLGQSDIFHLLTDWGNTTFNKKNSKVAYLNEQKGEIAINGEEYIVFSSTAVSLDRSIMKFSLIITCSDQAASLKLKGIRYEYTVGYQEDPLKYTAEKWITDEFAYNSKKNKLYRNNGKFRIATIDYANNIFDAAEIVLGLKNMTVNPLTGKTQVSEARSTEAKAEEKPAQKEVICPAKPQVTSQPQEGFVHFEADKIPTTILDMLGDNQLQLQAGTNKIAGSDIKWKGIGTMFGKKISTVSISKDNSAYKAIQSNESYKLSFFKPDAANDKPWMIIECNKQGETTESNEVLLIGEITNVWIK